MEPNELRDAVVRCIATRDDPVTEVRATPLRALEVLLEGVVRERLDDELAARLDGLSARRVSSDGARTLNIVGAFYTLMPGARGEIGNQRLSMAARLSLEPGAVSTVRVGGRGSLFDQSLSESRLQRLLESPWPHSFDLRLGLAAPRLARRRYRAETARNRKRGHRVLRSGSQHRPDS